MSILNAREFDSVKNNLEALVARGDQAGLARWAEKHGGNLMSQLGTAYKSGAFTNLKDTEVADDAPPAGRMAAAKEAVKEAGAKGIKVGKVILKEAAFRAMIEKFVGGVHAPAVRLVARWVTAQAGGDGKMAKRLEKTLGSKYGLSVVATVLSIMLLPFSKTNAETGLPENAAGKLVRELQTFAAQRAIVEGSGEMAEKLMEFAPMAMEMLGSGSDDAEGLLEMLGVVSTKVRAVGDEIELAEKPAETDEEEEVETRGAKAALKTAKAGKRGR